MSLVQDLKRQFGLVKDPDRVVIIPATETLPKLTRTITKNDNDQPGFPVFHRHTFASPFVAGNDEADLTAAQQRKPASTGSDMLCLPAGIGSTIAGLWFYPLGNTWGLSLYTLLGGVLISFAMADIPWTGIAAAYVGGAATPGEGALMFANALGILGMIAMLLIAMTGIASLKTSIPVTSSIIIVNVGLVLFSTSLFNHVDALAVAGGAIFIVVAILLYYLAIAELLADEGFPVLPVFPLPRGHH